ncbi:MAG: monovalent cation/H+ antiporter complex subunit F [Hyphomicrobiaceae bacterium]
MADYLLALAGAFILLGVLLGVVRLVRGPTSVDRVAAIDMLTVISISLIAIYAHVADRFIYLDVALVYGVLSFLGVLAIARYLERGL